MNEFEFLDRVERSVGTGTQFVFMPLEDAQLLTRLAGLFARQYAIRKNAGTGSQPEAKFGGGQVLWMVHEARRRLVRDSIKRLTS